MNELRVCSHFYIIILILQISSKVYNVLEIVVKHVISCFTSLEASRNAPLEEEPRSMGQDDSRIRIVNRTLSFHLIPPAITSKPHNGSMERSPSGIRGSREQIQVSAPILNDRA